MIDELKPEELPIKFTLWHRRKRRRGLRTAWIAICSAASLEALKAVSAKLPGEILTLPVGQDPNARRRSK